MKLRCKSGGLPHQRNHNTSACTIHTASNFPAIDILPLPPKKHLIFYIARFLELGLVQPFLMSALDAPDLAAVTHAVAAAAHPATTVSD